MKFTMVILLLMTWTTWKVNGQLQQTRTRTCCHIPQSELKKYQHIRDLSHKFLISIGVQKSGTTFLHNLMTKHPKIRGAWQNGFNGGNKKELRFFGKWGSANMAEYLSRFNITKLKEGFTLTEASPGYVAIPIAACRIKAFLPNARLVLIIKNPADRALSEYKMRFYKQMCWKQKTCSNKSMPGFYDAMKSDIDSFKKKNCDLINDSWGSCFHCMGEKTYITQGLYGPELKYWLQFFRPDQFLVINHEETSDVQAVADRIWEFAGVGPHKVKKVGGFRGNKYEPNEEVDRTMKMLEEFYAPYNRYLTEVMAKYLHVENFTFH
eukprot:TRINITY_DN1990_c0_g3_i4.p1 TRINITY_DN1990_c0_g3~~TRINITY_DN1990_c0_g3_i4.p1  ORF type:complete len:363 (-),score=11.50 TRINITY_DN1990_c0_g3_i4:489-1454(-)